MRRSTGKQTQSQLQSHAQQRNERTRWLVLLLLVRPRQISSVALSKAINSIVPITRRLALVTASSGISLLSLSWASISPSHYSLDNQHRNEGDNPNADQDATKHASCAALIDASHVLVGSRNGSACIVDCSAAPNVRRVMHALLAPILSVCVVHESIHLPDDALHNKQVHAEKQQHQRRSRTSTSSSKKASGGTPQESSRRQSQQLHSDTSADTAAKQVSRRIALLGLADGSMVEALLDEDGPMLFPDTLQHPEGVSHTVSLDQSPVPEVADAEHAIATTQQQQQQQRVVTACKDGFARVFRRDLDAVGWVLEGCIRVASAGIFSLEQISLDHLQLQSYNGGSEEQNKQHGNMPHALLALGTGDGVKLLDGLPKEETTGIEAEEIYCTQQQLVWQVHHPEAMRKSVLHPSANETTTDGWSSNVVAGQSNMFAQIQRRTTPPMLHVWSVYKREDNMLCDSSARYTWQHERSLRLEDAHGRAVTATAATPGQQLLLGLSDGSILLLS